MMVSTFLLCAVIGTGLLYIVLRKTTNILAKIYDNSEDIRANQARITNMQTKVARIKEQIALKETKPRRIRRLKPKKEEK